MNKVEGLGESPGPFIILQGIVHDLIENGINRNETRNLKEIIQIMRNKDS